MLPLLLGAAVTTVSVAPSRLDDVRALVRAADFASCRALFDKAGELPDAASVLGLVRSATGTEPHA
jgi:phosphoenolpyruvate-protein kinase (PTS system EI component)